MSTRTYRLLIVPGVRERFSATLYRDEWTGRNRRSRLELQEHSLTAESLLDFQTAAWRLVLDQSDAEAAKGWPGGEHQDVSRPATGQVRA